jgi:hypothetical protein
MKYIKTYESRNEKLYWLVPTDDRLGYSLKKIKCAKSFSEGIQNSIKEYYNGEYIFIGYNGKANTKISSSKWGFNQYKGELSDPYYEEEGYRFVGMVNIDEYELDANKYNL